jgi:hypothetical protein
MADSEIEDLLTCTIIARELDHGQRSPDVPFADEIQGEADRAADRDVGSEARSDARNTRLEA